MKPAGSAVRIAFVTAALLITTVFLYAHPHRELIPHSAGASSFPVQLGPWSGHETPIPKDQLEVLGPGDFLSRAYTSQSAAAPVSLYVAYFPSQRTGDTIHSPLNCLPGAGWSFVESKRMTLRIPGEERPLLVNHHIISKGTDQQLVLYWYQAHGRAVASEYWAKVYLVADSIRMNRTDGALVRIITPILPDESTAAAESRAISFANLAVPELDPIIPK